VAPELIVLVHNETSLSEVLRSKISQRARPEERSDEPHNRCYMLKARALFSSSETRMLSLIYLTAPSSAACAFRSEAELDLNRLKSEEYPKNPPDWQVGCNELLAGSPYSSVLQYYDAACITMPALHSSASIRDGADAVTPTTRRIRQSVFRLGESLASGLPLHPGRAAARRLSRRSSHPALLSHRVGSCPQQQPTPRP